VAKIKIKELPPEKGGKGIIFLFHFPLECDILTAVSEPMPDGYKKKLVPVTALLAGK